jgi:hypothetical protein
MKFLIPSFSCSPTPASSSPSAQAEASATIFSDKLEGACASPNWSSEPEQKEVSEIYVDDQNNYLLQLEVTSIHMYVKVNLAFPIVKKCVKNYQFYLSKESPLGNIVCSINGEFLELPEDF